MEVPLVGKPTWPRGFFLAAGVAVLFALAARLSYFLQTDFPLNDGGMFLSMSRDIRDAGYALPAFASYNGGSIPFAYPPLAFYITALISGVTGLELTTLVRYLPLLANLATVVAVGVLARSLLGFGWAALVAPAIFALIPRSYLWMVMGGGLTRSLGFLFAIACLGLARELYARPTLGRTLLCGGFAAAALATHLELGIFTFISLVGIAFLSARSPRAVLISGGLVLLALLLASPWWVTVIARHGLAPFDAASLASYWATPGDGFSAFEQATFPSDPFLGFLGALAVVGAVACAIRGEYFLPLWLPAVFIVVPRSAPSEATVPLALLAAVGLAGVVLPGLAGMLRAPLAPARLLIAGSALPLSRQGLYLSRGLEVVALLLVLWVVYQHAPGIDSNSLALESLPVEERQSMEWISRQVPGDARFLVLSSAWAWEGDYVGEWFPVLANSTSLLTPQGSEWLPGEAFDRRKCLYSGVRNLAGGASTVADLDGWARDRGVAFTHIYVSKSMRWNIDWSTVLATALRSPDYKLLMDNDWVAVLERREPIAPPWTPNGDPLVGRDCQSLADQPEETRRAFVAAYGGQAEWEFREQHDRELGEPVSLCTRLDQFGLGRLALVQSQCGDAASAGSSGSSP